MTTPQPNPAELPTWRRPGYSLDRPNPIRPSLPPPAEPQPITYQPEQDSRLDQLLGEYERLWPEVTQKTKQLEGLKTSIKAELSRLFPGREVTVTSPSLKQPLRHYPQDRVKVLRELIQKTYPGVWARCTKVKTIWILDKL